jgi:hypothetical protein
VDVVRTRGTSVQLARVRHMPPVTADAERDQE